MTRRPPREAPRERMSDAHHAAITLELARLTLGHRGPDRPELVAPLVEHDVRRRPRRRRTR